MADEGGEARSSDTLAGLTFRQVVEMAESVDANRSAGPPASAQPDGQYPQRSPIDVCDVAMDGSESVVAGRLYRGRESTGIGFVWVHGGAFIGGSLDMPEAHWVSLELASSGIAVLSLDYRKALRGVHYPAPSDDVLTGWTWATRHADELGAEPDDLHLGGASAGGNLAAGVAKRLRDGAGALPASLVLVYPVVHGELPPLSPELWDKLTAAQVASDSAASMVRDMTAHYAGDEAALADPYAFAANGDVGGQPPVYILNSETDYLRASGEAYAAALRRAGVDVTVEIEPGTRHGHVNGPDQAGASRSIERIATWLRNHDTRPRDG